MRKTNKLKLNLRLASLVSLVSLVSEVSLASLPSQVSETLFIIATEISASAYAKELGLAH